MEALSRGHPSSHHRIRGQAPFSALKHSLATLFLFFSFTLLNAGMIFLIGNRIGSFALASFCLKKMVLDFLVLKESVKE
jgi:hypothetical protein